MPTVSIVVPVYKAEKTLDACVESILAQTFSDFELLLIDDASPDRCPQMCDAWAEKDPRIHALHPAKTGPGPSGARNAGLDAAAAPWITMVDSDDTVAPDLLETLLAGAERTGAELVLCNCCPVTEDGARHPLPENERFTEETLFGVEAFWTPSARHGSTSSPARRTGCTPPGCLRMPATRWACCMRITTCCPTLSRAAQGLPVCPIQATMSCAMQAASRTVPDTRCVWQ